MGYGIAFEPLASLPVLAIAAVAAILVSALLIISHSRGALLRAAALGLALLALGNPSFTREDREPLTSVVAVVVDKSASQRFGDRAKVAEDARVALTD